ncbi:MAG: glucosamine-6-phosphate deaminase [Bryobacteraceae bacterium]|nr:glucosamine-6-phosphate deaminase [Bryobacteraceae bacterium]
MELRIFDTSLELGVAAAADAAEVVRAAIAARGQARIVVATGNSQLHTVEAFTTSPGIDWSVVDMFHLDEYAGMSADHPASFRRWIRTRVEERVHPRTVHYMEGDAVDLDAELRRYSELLDAAPIDVTFLGIGENGHIAFNDPHVADFEDSHTVRRVTLDDACRRQQVGEGHFSSLDEVPLEACTVTCSALLRMGRWVCSVPELRKAQAVRCAVEGPVSEACPASLVQRYPDAAVYLDRDSASLLTHR